MNSSTSSSDLKAFSCRIVLYGFLFLSVLVAACFFLPSKHARETMLGSQITKLKALEALPGERVVIVGGSGSGQGFVTSNICAALNRPAYNMGLHAGLGLIYQMAAVEPLIRRNDIVLLIPEYANFDGSTCFGNAELLMMVTDIIPKHKKLLTFDHWMHLLPLMPKYGADKLRRAFTKDFKINNVTRYDLYGDAIIPNGLKSDARLPILAGPKIAEGAYSGAIMPYILDFARRINDRGERLCFVPPALMMSSYVNGKTFAEKIYKEVERSGVPCVGFPNRYALADHFFYDTPYHLNLNGRLLRTKILIEDIAALLN